MNILHTLFVSSFIFAVLLDWLIKNKYLGNKIYLYYLKFININLSYFSLYFILFSIVLLILFILDYFNIVLFTVTVFDNSLIDIIYQNFQGDGEVGESSGNNNSNNSNAPNNSNSSSSESNNPNLAKNNVNVITNLENKGEFANLNLNHPRLNVSLPASSINNIAAVASSTSGAALGYKIAQSVSGSPLIKIGTGLAVMGGVQAGTAMMSSILNKNINDKDKTKFIGDLINNVDSNILLDKYPEFPLNLLSHMNTLVNLEVIGLIVLLNIFIVNLLIKIDFNKYIPNNKLGKLVLFFIKRYIKIWETSQQILMVLTLMNLTICIVFLKIGFFYIINS